MTDETPTDEPVAAPGRKSGRRKKLILLAVTLLICLGVLEVVGRVWVSRSWPPHRIEAMQALGDAQGRYLIVDGFGYILRPSHTYTDRHNQRFTTNSWGFRGREIAKRKPNRAVRIFTMGGSTVYGIGVANVDTASSILERGLKKAFPKRRIQVQNAGTPGWTSEDTVRNLKERVVGFDPDVVLIMDGRNDVWPQLYRNYRDDYSHYRTLDPAALRGRQTFHKRMFRYSYFFMLLSWKRPHLTGFSDGPLHGLILPPYTRANYDNFPTAEETAEFVEDERRFVSFERNLRECVGVCRAHGITPVLGSVVWAPDRFRSTLLPDYDRDALDTAVRRNNAATKRVCEDMGVTFFDGFSITSDDNVFDDCHMTKEGEAAMGRLWIETVKPLIE